MRLALAALLLTTAPSWAQISNPPAIQAPQPVTISGHAVSPGGSVNLSSSDIAGLSASATVDATSAANISTGTLPAGRLPALTGDCTTSAGSAATSCIPKRATATVATLPSCVSGLRGSMYFVTNALAPVALATVAGGGAVQIGVTCDGTNWIVQ